MPFFDSFLDFVRARHPWAAAAFLHPSFTNHFISPALVTLSESEIQIISEAISAISGLRQDSDFIRDWTDTHPSKLLIDPGYESGYMGFDFYLTDQGPRLIEINTNAAAQLVVSFLNEFQGQNNGVAQTEGHIRQMYQDQFSRFGRFETPAYSVILDESASEQKTYFDMALHAAMMAKWGWNVRIADVADLKWDEPRQRLVDSITNQDVDFIYNRYCDFELSKPESEALKSAWLAQAICLSPNPFDYLILAKKSNLAGLSGLEIPAIKEVLPEVRLASDFSRDVLWEKRRGLFFKPQAGFGSRGCYRGDGITRGAFEAVLENDYVVQPLFVSRVIEDPALPEPMKFDVRVYTYGGQIQGWAARLFVGQVTNFRTLGGGFASLRNPPV